MSKVNRDKSGTVYGEQDRDEFWRHIQIHRPDVAKDLKRVAGVFGRGSLGPSVVAGKRYPGDWM